MYGSIVDANARLYNYTTQIAGFGQTANITAKPSMATPNTT
jgi:hypothetical protein